MSNWFTWNELLDRWKLEDFELFNYFKMGLQPYSRYGKKVVDKDVLERGRRQSLEEIEKSIHAKQHARVLGSGSGPPLTNGGIKYKAKLLYDSQPLVIVNPPKNCHLTSFNLPLNEVKARKQLSAAMRFRFKKDEVLKFEKEHGLLSNLNQFIDNNQKSATPRNIGDLIKNIEISYENDNEIKIKVPQKKAQNAPCDILGFRDNTTSEWQTLLQILQDPNHTYEVGKAHTISNNIKVRNRGYDRKMKCLKRVSDKLVIYLSKSNSLKIPGDYKLLESAKDMGKGVYKPVFKVGLALRYDNVTSWEFKYDQYPKDHLLEEIEKLTDKFKKNKTDELNKKKLITAGKIAVEKKWIKKDEVEKLINPRVDDEFIQKETSDSRFEPEGNKDINAQR